MKCFKVIVAGEGAKFGCVIQRTEEGTIYLHTLAGVVEELRPEEIVSIEVATAE